MGHEMVSAKNWTPSALDSILNTIYDSQLRSRKQQPKLLITPHLESCNKISKFLLCLKSFFASGETYLGLLCKKKKTKAGSSNSLEAVGQHFSFPIVSVSEYGKHVSLFKGKIIRQKPYLLKRWYNVVIHLLEGHVYRSFK